MGKSTAPLLVSVPALSSESEQIDRRAFAPRCYLLADIAASATIGDPRRSTDLAQSYRRGVLGLGGPAATAATDPAVDDPAVDDAAARVPEEDGAGALTVVLHDRAGALLGGAHFDTLTGGDGARVSHTRRIWAGRAGSRTLGSAIEARTGEGIVEMRGVFVVPYRYPSAPAPAVARALARTIPIAATAFGARWILGCAPRTSVPIWVESGAEVAVDVDPCPYPDDRFRTQALWWDARSIWERATAVERRSMVVEHSRWSGRRSR